MSLALSKPHHVLVTGVTGFLGKVVLEELIRLDQGSLDTIYVMIRPGRKGVPPAKRFYQEVANSPCFKNFKPGWIKKLVVLPADLSQDRCGLSESDFRLVTHKVTHIINCAASVDFDLPIHEAAQSNIQSSLHVLDLAKQCQSLTKLVHVSTAYVTPYPGRGVEIDETLFRLPRPASNFYNDILTKAKSGSDLLKETGHPNTYTLTKCLAEHLLFENRNTVPLTIIRPSIISASWKYPFNGWIDSRAAFAGFVALIGSGYLRAVAADESSSLDIVPVDYVAEQTVTSCFQMPHSEADFQIKHAVAGLDKNCRNDLCGEIITDYFKKHPTNRASELFYVGPRTLQFFIKQWQHHHVPFWITKLGYRLINQPNKAKQVDKLLGKLSYLNDAFEYFTHHSFQFKSSRSEFLKDLTPTTYIQTVCKGVYENLLGRSESEIVLAGKDHHSKKSDLSWALSQPEGNWAIRLGAYLVRKVLRRGTRLVTFDRPSFERALANRAPQSLTVLVPTHRSYLDFVLCSYLCFSQPNMGLKIPHIAAASEFGKIPFLGWLLKQAHAFYIQRGLGKENQKLSEQVRQLVQQGESLEFYVEGTRSRSRRFLSPKRGLIRCLQNTGETCSLLPISISYDRIPEEKSFYKELTGSPKPKMTLKSLFKWVSLLVRGNVKLGRIHLRCGDPIVLGPQSDRHQVARHVVGQLQKQMPTSLFHLRTFLAHHALVRFDVNWLARQIEKRGGDLVPSQLKGEHKIDFFTERGFRYHWMHLFYPEARTLFVENVAIQNHIRRHDFGSYAARSLDPLEDQKNMLELFRCLFEPICRNHETLIEFLKQNHFQEGEFEFSTLSFVRHHPQTYLPDVEDAMADLIDQQVLQTGSSKGHYVWGPAKAALDQLLNLSRWRIPLQISATTSHSQSQSPESPTIDTPTRMSS